MCAIFLLTRLLYRDRCHGQCPWRRRPRSAAFDPRQLFTASFQMTFVCVLIVAAIGLPLIERTSHLYRRPSLIGTPTITVKLCLLESRSSVSISV